MHLGFARLKNWKRRRSPSGCHCMRTANIKRSRINARRLGASFSELQKPTSNFSKTFWKSLLPAEIQGRTPLAVRYGRIPNTLESASTGSNELLFASFEPMDVSLQRFCEQHCMLYVVELTHWCVYSRTFDLQKTDGDERGGRFKPAGDFAIACLSCVNNRSLPVTT